MGHSVQRFEPGFLSGRFGGRIGHRLDQERGVIHSATDNLPSLRAKHKKALWREPERGPLEVVIICRDFLWPAEVAELKRTTKDQVAMCFPDAISNFGGHCS